MLYDILEFPDISRPFVGVQDVQNLLPYCQILPGEFLDKKVREDRDIFLALPQRFYADLNDIEAVVQVLAEFLLLDELLQVLVGSRDDPHVERDRLIAADALHFPLLNDAQELDLHVKVHVSDLVEEDRAAVG